MSSDEEDALCSLNLLNILNTNTKKVRNYWVHPFLLDNCRGRSAFSVFKDLEDSDRFQSSYRMEKNTFDMLVELVGSKIQKKDTNYRRSVYPRERIFLTLR
ncbi:protein ALP1-like [Aphis craccivora]|uniref:Protein ALP1-like n=1 Tax=Aphis craccivora TaxID=307492 RepID=A0A6G0WNN5_APHCR|nr:protein ALP1-like [Aphis craccivora]